MKFMKYCEGIVKSKLSCGELVYKIYEIEKISKMVLIKRTSSNVRPQIHKEYINEDDNSKLVEIKRASDSIKEDIK